MTGRIIAFGTTDQGQRRARNEDAFIVDDDQALFAVADGMGGAKGGHVASRMVVDNVRQRLDELRRGSSPGSEAWRAHWSAAVADANAAIFDRADRDPDLRGMGTTFTGLTIDGEHAYLAHVGDSRAYRIRGRTIEQISADHTYINELIKAGLLRRGEPTHSTLHHVLSRAVGVSEVVEVDVSQFTVCAGDVFVLCSDGLANVVSESEILEAVLDTFLGNAPDRLVRLANKRGGPDNITVVIVCVNDIEANDGDTAASRSA